MTEALFWLSIAGASYPYIGYPLLLWVLAALRRDAWSATEGALPRVTVIVPVHNEAARIRQKIANTANLRYPSGQMQVVFVSDGSTDETVTLIRDTCPSAELIELPSRSGKAAALNAGLAAARHELLVFSDASIELEADALEKIVKPFSDPSIGCVSGEDRIPERGGEGLYGRYELLLRRLESTAGSIVGASGSFYAQRAALCVPFTPGMAPDFLSVLRTVERGLRAVAQPAAAGSMTSVKDPREEFDRKVRTLLRGMTTLFEHRALLNPFKFPFFAFALVSHKLLRWVAPVFLVGALVTSLALAGSPLYLAAFLGQAGLYLLALVALKQVRGVHDVLPARLALYFTSVNAAVLVAWIRYLSGERQEIWTPSQRRVEPGRRTERQL
jgi:cellulose synthase/poly-beta-1,6-N-acetylglucosamine synthase-like glycosyltransferase